MSKELNEKELDQVAGGMEIFGEFTKEKDEAKKEFLASLKVSCPTCKTTLTCETLKEIDGILYLYCGKCNKDFPVLLP